MWPAGRKGAGKPMSGTVLKLVPETLGDDVRFDPDQTLEDTKGCDAVTLAIIGLAEDGTVWLTGNANAGELLILMERAKHQIVFGEE